MTNYIWGGLNKAVNDPTLIDQAIETAVGAHNDDPDAHLGADQALQSHRAAVIIDHLAESVVNDKIVLSARAYTAIVDPTTGYDYDTLDAALAFVIARGGGSILVKAGEHFIEQTLTVPRGINIIGEGVGVTNIHAATDGVPAFNFAGGVEDDNAQTIIERCTFVRNIGNIFTGASQTSAGKPGIYFRDCSFENGGAYGLNITNDFSFESCIFDLSTEAAFDVISFYARQCVFTSATAGIALTASAQATDGACCALYDCFFEAVNSDIITGRWHNSLMINTAFVGVHRQIPCANSGCAANKFIGCSFMMNAKNDAYIDGVGLVFNGNGFTAAETDSELPYLRFRSSSTNCIFTSNFVVHQVLNTGTGNQIAVNVEQSYTVPPPPIGENIAYTDIISARVGTAYTSENTDIMRDGTVIFYASFSSNVVSLKTYKYGGASWAQIGADSMGSGTWTAWRMNTYSTVWLGQKYTSNTAYTLYKVVVSGSTTTTVSAAGAATIKNIIMRDCNSDGTVYLATDDSNPKNIRVYTLSGSTLTLASTYTMPQVLINGVLRDPRAGECYFANDGTRVYVKDTQNGGFYILSINGTVLSFVQTPSFTGFASPVFKHEKPDKSLVFTQLNSPYLCEMTYDSGSYSNINTFGEGLTGIPLAVTTVSTDGSLAVSTNNGGQQTYFFRHTNEEYIISDNSLDIYAYNIHSVPTDSNSGTLVYANAYTHQKITGRFVV